MARAFQGDDFARVADFLLNEPAENVDEQVEWDDCEDARARSAISRAYYGPFLLLKQRLQGAREDWKRNERRFPREDVHLKLLSAVERKLGVTHQLLLYLKPLLRERKKADYESTLRYDTESADSFVDQAWDAIQLIGALDSARVRQVADELYDIDREARSSSRGPTP